MLISLFSFSTGAYLLISSMFNASLQRETVRAQNENAMLRMYCSAALQSSRDINRATYDSILRAVSYDGALIARVLDYDKSEVFANSTKFDNTLIDSLSTGNQGYIILRDSEGSFIQCAGLVTLGGKTMYLETKRNISDIYSQRDDHFAMFSQIVAVFILINGIAVFLLSSYLTRPIKRLSSVARKIARGNIHERVYISSNDEIGMLSEDFNLMASEVEAKITELEELNHRQEDFVASFAHELKTPLTSMIGYADMLRSRNMEPEDRFLAAGYIFSEGKRLENISLKLLELIVLQKQDFEFKRVSAAQLFRDVQLFLLPTLSLGEIEFRASCEDSVLRVEPDLIKTLLLNLLDNAKKAIDIHGLITLQGRIEDGGYAIYIRDNGKGVSAEDLPRITEAFYMADKSRSRKSGGAGLGLAISAEIVKLHHGSIEFKSELGKGTVVRAFIAS